jgi:hypothetical protein
MKFKPGQRLNLKPSQAVSTEPKKKRELQPDNARIRGRWQIRYLFEVCRSNESGSGNYQMRNLTLQACIYAQNDKLVKDVNRKYRDLEDRKSERGDRLLDAEINAVFQFLPPESEPKEFTIRVYNQDIKDKIAGMAAGCGVPEFAFVQVYIAKYLLKQNACKGASKKIMQDVIDYWDRWLATQYRRLDDILNRLTYA